MEHVLEAVRPWGMTASGALFGAGWACFCDVVVRNAVVGRSGVPFVYYLPGLAATFAVLLMALLQRDDGGGAYLDEGDQCRNKSGLFLAFCCCFGAMAGAVVVLVQLQQQGGDTVVGVGAVIQTGILCLSGLLAWLCKSSESSDDYSLLGW